MKKHIITISGQPGSGKSSTANGIAEKLNYKRFSSGDFFRKIGLDLGISLAEISKRAETDSKIDELTDEEIKKLSNETNIVIDSRLAYHFIPDSFKVFLEIDPQKAEERIMKDLETNELRKQSENSNSLEEIINKRDERIASEKKRYWNLYGIKYGEKENYDLVVDSGERTLEENIDFIISSYNKWLNN